MPRKGFKMPSHEQIMKGFKPKPDGRSKSGGTKHAKATGAPLCGAKKRKGGRCGMGAGWGTNHPGTGRCKLHGGSTPNHVKSAIGDEYRKLLGKELEINPFDALLWVIRIRAGEVKWLTERINELDEKDWVESSIVGKQFHLYARERQAAMNDLARFSQMAISLGIAERSVRLAEQYGETLARLIKGILEELDLSPQQALAAPGIVRKHLVLVSSAPTPQSALAAKSTQKQIEAKVA